MVVVIAKEVRVRNLNYKLCIVSRDRLLIQATGITIHLLATSAKVWSNRYSKKTSYHGKILVLKAYRMHQGSSFSWGHLKLPLAVHIHT